MTDEFGYKVCPSCREEYTLVMQRCAACDVDLVSPDALPQDDDDEPMDFPPASELVYLRVAPLPWIRALSDALEESEIPHRVEPAGLSDPPADQRPEIFGDVDLFGLYVLPDHEAGAREFDSAIASQVLPDEAEELAPGQHDSCPACAAKLAPDATHCPDCGLGLG